MENLTSKTTITNFNVFEKLTFDKVFPVQTSILLLVVKKKVFSFPWLDGSKFAVKGLPNKLKISQQIKFLCLNFWIGILDLIAREILA